VERRIVEAAEGNPLFVEEFLAMLLDDGVILRAGDEWVATTDLTAITTPASIMALLAARLDRLSDDERKVLERAAVVGKVFTREAVEALVEHETMPDVVRRFGALVHKELIWPDRPSPDSPDSYRFKHMLIRDAAYAGLSKSERAELHERFADFQERAAGHRLTEYEEIIGYHLEQATHYRQQLGRDDERTRELARRAAQLLGAAGVRALQRGDALASSRLLERCRAIWQRSKRT
jgi:predicted ATPase